MLKETIASFLVLGGVAVAVADTRDTEPVAISVQREARKLPLDVSDDILLDAALIRLPMEYAVPATRMRRAHQRTNGPRPHGDGAEARRKTRMPAAQHPGPGRGAETQLGARRLVLEAGRLVRACTGGEFRPRFVPPVFRFAAIAQTRVRSRGCPTVDCEDDAPPPILDSLAVM